MVPDIVLTDAPSLDDRTTVLKGLVAFNEAHAGPSDWRALAVLARDPATGRTLGGLCGGSYAGWLFVELLWLPETLRRGGIGTRLMRAAEAEAARRGCCGVWLDTYSFQARGFYERLGYTLFGTLDNCPPGFQRFYLCKRLAGAAAAD
ncbi:MAG TPA: GNAT family N-acetyltransferase [Candidatus Sulfotelmatobacter sp.]|nr:GNAT family N-acetyltransferase [Candidatus Sulfotelmatobacter sp.]